MDMCKQLCRQGRGRGAEAPPDLSSCYYVYMQLPRKDILNVEKRVSFVHAQLAAACTLACVLPAGFFFLFVVFSPLLLLPLEIQVAHETIV